MLGSIIYSALKKDEPAKPTRGRKKPVAKKPVTKKPVAKPRKKS
jgi:hypothetical protein